MAISKESKAAIKAEIETLNAKRRIARDNLSVAEKVVAKMGRIISDIDAAIAKLETDLG